MPTPSVLSSSPRASSRRQRARIGRIALAVALAGSWLATTGEAVDARAMVIMEPPPPPFDPRVQQAVVTRDHGPPPISGGTLTALSGDRVLVADADGDRVIVAGAPSGEAPHVTLTLVEAAGSEPGRSVEDASGRVHVVLRGSGQVLSFDPRASGPDAAQITRRAVCSMPRGIALDRASDQLVVACRGGEIVFLPASGDRAPRTVNVAPDLRDVVIAGDRLVATRFRTAETLVLDRADGHVISRQNAAPAPDQRGAMSAAAVAWRAIALPGGEVAMLHQRETLDEVQPAPGGYGGFGGCDGIVKTAISILGGSALRAGPTIAAATLPVDLAAHVTERRLSALALVAAGNQNGDRSVIVLAPTEIASSPCTGGRAISPPHSVANAIAVAFLADGRLAVQTRAPARLVVVDAALTGSQELALGGEDTFDTGHSIFHASAGGHIACASCHPEGGEDGHVWRFAGLGARRTPALHDVAGTAPFHWQADLASMEALVDEVFVGRMNGVPLSSAHVQALEGWLGHVPRPLPRASSTPRVERGREVFASAGCGSCHSGDRLSDGLGHDVGTGRELQTPTLRGVSARLPVMHDGCASTLRDRFTPSCGGDRHGRTVEGADLDALLAYLETL